MSAPGVPAGGKHESLPAAWQADGFWNEVVDVDAWLDEAVDGVYRKQWIAQDWARVAKISEEAGEAIAELILATGQNPRKGTDLEARERLLHELADAALTGILAIQHFTKDSTVTREIVEQRMRRIWNRLPVERTQE